MGAHEGPVGLGGAAQDVWRVGQGAQRDEFFFTRDMGPPFFASEESGVVGFFGRGEREEGLGCGEEGGCGGVEGVRWWGGWRWRLGRW